MEKYKTKTTEFSFILKPAKCGVGVFTTHNIKVKTFLRLFGGNENKNCLTLMTRDKKNVPKSFQLYCIDRGKKLICPNDFGSMDIGWYLNHSKTPNAFHRNYNYYALQNIKLGEEITINYNTLEEPKIAKENYYKK